MATYDAYYPISTAETSSDDGASVRAIVDLAKSINNAKMRALGPKLVSLAWPGGFTVPATTDTVETTFLLLPPRYLQRGLPKITWCLSIDSVVDLSIRLYLAERLPSPVAEQDFTATQLSTIGRYASSQILTTGGAGPQRLVQTGAPMIDPWGNVNIFATIQRASGSGTQVNPCAIYALDISAGGF